MNSTKRQTPGTNRQAQVKRLLNDRWHIIGRWALGLCIAELGVMKPVRSDGAKLDEICVGLEINGYLPAEF